MVVGEAVILGQVADPAADHGGAGPASQSDAAIGPHRDAKQDLDQRGLAGAVLAEQAEDFAGLDFQGDAFEGRKRLDLA